MARRIEKRYGAVFHVSRACFGKIVMPRSLACGSVSRKRPHIDAAQTPKRAGGIEKRLGERRFPGVHVRKNADAQRGHFRI